MPIYMNALCAVTSQYITLQYMCVRLTVDGRTGRGRVRSELPPGQSSTPGPHGDAHADIADTVIVCRRVRCFRSVARFRYLFPVSVYVTGYGYANRFLLLSWLILLRCARDFRRLGWSPRSKTCRCWVTLSVLQRFHIRFENYVFFRLTSPISLSN